MMPIEIRVKNWKLAILALLFILIFARLGFWQLQRAEEKKSLLTKLHQRVLLPPLLIEKITTHADYRFYRVQLQGQFDETHNILLDNKIVHGRVGYEIFTPFKTSDGKHALLVDRGFTPLTGSRDTLPTITNIKGPTTIIGMVNEPPKSIYFGSISDADAIHWPLRVQYLDIAKMSQRLNYPLLPYIVTLNAQTDGIEDAQIVSMPPEKHQAYALQWFAFALTLLILFVLLGIQLNDKKPL